VARTEISTPVERAQKRASYLSGLLWHAGTYVIINAFFLALDIIGGQGVNWSLWITLMWGLALAFHALAYYVDGRGLEEHKTEQYLAEAQEREAHLMGGDAPGSYHRLDW